jgi:hypothetical protein
MVKMTQVTKRRFRPSSTAKKLLGGDFFLGFLPVVTSGPSPCDFCHMGTFASESRRTQSPLSGGNKSVEILLAGTSACVKFHQKSNPLCDMAQAGPFESSVRIRLSQEFQQLR